MGDSHQRLEARGEALETRVYTSQAVRFGWQRVVVQAPDGPYAQQHILPVNDWRPHRLGEDCPCRPVEDAREPDIWAHNAWDQREGYADGSRKMN